MMASPLRQARQCLITLSTVDPIAKEEKTPCLKQAKWCYPRSPSADELTLLVRSLRTKADNHFHFFDFGMHRNLG
jgi:hypothetical protein